MAYSDDDMLMLSGIQHFVFCPRQWALIHIEQQWADNRLTAEGTLLHKNVDDPFRRATDGMSPVVTLRGFRLVSETLGLSGIADAVELHPTPDAPADKAALIESRRFTALPIEYKRGRRKTNPCDRLQVAAQAVILQEMLGMEIPRGAIFYWEERHREYFDITPQLKSQVCNIAGEMHRIMSTRCLPAPVLRKECRSCSIKEVCLPSLSGRSADRYLNDCLYEKTT